jgi:chromosome segregation protein
MTLRLVSRPTALLRILLAQSGMPLIIDQPEEDLDSQVVLEVVSWIWTAG